MTSHATLAPAASRAPGPSQARGVQNYKRNTNPSACDYCKRKKTKCTGDHPCERCTNHRVNCEYSVQKPGEKPMEARERRERESADRISSLEALQLENEETIRNLQAEKANLIAMINSRLPETDGIRTGDEAIKALVIGTGRQKRRADSDSPSMPLRKIRGEFPASADMLMVQNSQLRQELEENRSELNRSCQQPYKTIVDQLQTADQFVAEDMLWHLQNGTFIPNAALPSIPVPQTPPFRYPFPYRDMMPEYLDVPCNRYLRSSRLAGALKFNQGKPGTVYDSVYTKPFHTAKLDEPRLIDADGNYVNVERWTKVRCKNKLLHELLEAYFMYEHAEYTFIHKDFFLEDLRDNNTQFCSELLVNAVLAAACHCLDKLPKRYRMCDDPQAMGYKFLMEAQRLMENMENDLHLTTLQATLILDVLMGIQGRGLRNREAREHRISKLEHIISEPTDIRGRQAFALLNYWSFCWQSMSSFFTNRRPRRTTRPVDPLPHPRSNRGWYGESFLIFPGDNTSTPVHTPEISWARLNLHCLFNEIVNETWTEGDAPEGYLTLYQAKEFHSKLQEWYSSLPKEIDAENMCRPNELRLHMEYYYAVLKLFEPHCQRSSSAKQIVDDARILYETVARLYFARHSFKAHDSLLLCLLACLDGQVQRAGYPEEDMLSTRFICANGIYNAAQSFNLATVYYGHYRHLRWNDPYAWQMCRREAGLVKDEELAADVDLGPDGCKSEWWDPSIGPHEDHKQWTMNALAEKYINSPYEKKQQVLRPVNASAQNSGGDHEKEFFDFVIINR